MTWLLVLVPAGMVGWFALVGWALSGILRGAVGTVEGIGRGDG